MFITITKNGCSPEVVNNFILIKIDGEPGKFVKSECISTVVDSLYRSQILGDHSNWEFGKFIKEK